MNKKVENEGTMWTFKVCVRLVLLTTVVKCLRISMCWARRHLYQVLLGRPPCKTRGHARRTRGLFSRRFPSLPFGAKDASFQQPQPPARTRRVPHPGRGSGGEHAACRGERCRRAPARLSAGLRYIKGPEQRRRAMPSPRTPLGSAPGSGCPFPGLPHPAPVPIHRRLLSQTFIRRGVPPEQDPRPPPLLSRSPPRRHRLSIAPPLRRDRTPDGKLPQKPAPNSPSPAAAPERPGPQRWHCQGPRGR